jgi:hypothetical protein
MCVLNEEQSAGGDFGGLVGGCLENAGAGGGVDAAPAA